MTKSEQNTEYVLRLIAAPVFGLVAATTATVMVLLPVFVLVLVGAPLAQSRSLELLALGAAAILRGFAFVFFGSMAATIRWRVRAATILLSIGVAFEFYLRSYWYYEAVSDRGSFIWVWQLALATAGGLLAVAIRHFRRHEKTS